MKTSKAISLYPVIIALMCMMAIVAFTGCDKEAKERPASFMKVRMHDSIGDYSAVNVHIQAAEVHVTDTFDSAGWYPLEVNAGVYNLLELQHGVDTVLANESQLPSGRISQLRFLLGDSNSIVLNDSSIHDLDTPSANASGLKINVHKYLEPNHVYELSLDFDVHHSIVVTGNQGYKLKPVIRVDSIYVL